MCCVCAAVTARSILDSNHFIVVLNNCTKTKIISLNYTLICRLICICNSAFEQGNLDLWRYINAFIIYL